MPKQKTKAMLLCRDNSPYFEGLFLLTADTNPEWDEAAGIWKPRSGKVYASYWTARELMQTFNTLFGVKKGGLKEVELSMKIKGPAIGETGPAKGKSTSNGIMPEQE